MLRDARMTRQSVAAAGRDKINHGGQMDKSFIFFSIFLAGDNCVIEGPFSD